MLCREVKLQVETAVDLAPWSTCSQLCTSTVIPPEWKPLDELVPCSAAGHVKISVKQEIGSDNCFMLELGGGTWQIRSSFEQWVGAWLNSAGEVVPAKSAGCGYYRIGGPFSFPADRAEVEGLLKILSAFKVKPVVYDVCEALREAVEPLLVRGLPAGK